MFLWTPLMFVDGTINLFCVIRFAAPFLILYFPPVHTSFIFLMIMLMMLMTPWMTVYDYNKHQSLKPNVEVTFWCSETCKWWLGRSPLSWRCKWGGWAQVVQRGRCWTKGHVCSMGHASQSGALWRPQSLVHKMQAQPRYVTHTCWELWGVPHGRQWPWLSAEWAHRRGR